MFLDVEVKTVYRRVRRERREKADAKRRAIHPDEPAWVVEQKRLKEAAKVGTFRDATGVVPRDHQPF